MAEWGFQIARLVAVVLLVGGAAALATPPGRLPLALRGVMRILHRDRGMMPPTAVKATASIFKRFLAFVMILFALGLCLI